jgi:hypothetical protein
MTLDYSYSKQVATEDAVRFLSSMRGKWIMARALHYGIKELSRVEGVHREVSDIADMQYLMDELFNLPVEILEPSKLEVNLPSPE